MLHAIEVRHIKYNETLEKIEKLEKEGLVYAFRPIDEIKVGRLEKDVNKLMIYMNKVTEKQWSK